MASIIQIRRDTASDWTSANPTLAQGELALETDTLKLKAGDGTTAWTSLAYYTLGTAGYLATTGGALTGALTTNSTIDGVDIATRDGILTSTTTTANAALPRTGGALTGALTTNSTIDGVDIATRDGVLTSTTSTANTANTTAAAALAKSGGAMTGAITTNSTFDGRDVAADGVTADAALPKAGGTVTGLVNMSDQILQRTVLKDYGETKVAMAAHAVDLELGNVFTYTLSGGQTVTFTNPPASGTAGSFTMIVTNGGSATLTWPTSVDWPAATAPTLTASGVDVLFFTTIDGGTIWYGTAVLAMG
jgi:hypothetical protein